MFRDPTVVGWLAVVAYLFSAHRCWLAYRSAPAIGRVWAGLALLLLSLGINKQLDVQTLFMDLAKQLAVAQGWYAERRRVQAVFMAVVAVGALLPAGWLIGRLRRGERGLGWASVGVLCLLGYVLIRAALSQKLSSLEFLRQLPGALGIALELAGIGCVAVGALVALRPGDRSPP